MMTFARPEGCLQENERLEVEANLSNIIVLDEHNVFITDAQAAYRFDSTTDELHLIEGSYALGNQGVTIESIISPNGMMAIDGHIYAGAGGFWSETKLVEFSKDSNQINRTLALGKGNLISGLCLLDDSNHGTSQKKQKSGQASHQIISTPPRQVSFRIKTISISRKVKLVFHACQPITEK